MTKYNKTCLFAAACASLLVTAPAVAQSSFTMVIGEFAPPRVATPAAPLDTETMIEVAAERACARPFLRNLKGREQYRACLTEARAEALTQIEQRARGTELAIR